MADDDFIQCPIWDKYEKRAQGLIKKINETKDLQGKVNRASAIIEAEKILLECGHFKNNDPVCKIHKGIAELRSKTAEIVMKFPGAGRKLK